MNINAQKQNNNLKFYYSPSHFHMPVFLMVLLLMSQYRI